jgi:hypothetical protein
MVDIYCDYLISFNRWYWFLILFFRFDKLPDIVFWYMIGAVGTAGDFIEMFAFW